MLRGERASLEGDHLRAAALFERAALTFETTGDPICAADAYLELGVSLLYLDRGAEIPPLAQRVTRLVSGATDLPAGSFLLLRVFATILVQANENRGPFVDLAYRRRRIRHPKWGSARLFESAAPEAENAS